MTDGATMPAFSDERLIDAAGAVVADRPEQRPLLVVAVASRLEVGVDAPPTPPTEPSAGVERWIGSIKLYRLGSSAGRHACHHLLALMGCKTLPRVPVSRTRRPETASRRAPARGQSLPRSRRRSCVCIVCLY